MKRARTDWERVIAAGMLTAMPKRCPCDATPELLREVGAAYQHMGLADESRRFVGWAEALAAALAQAQD